MFYECVILCPAPYVCLMLYAMFFFAFFFFKQKTAYEMRISDWSSDVCSSDLLYVGRRALPRLAHRSRQLAGALCRDRGNGPLLRQIGRASCRERVCQYV